MDVLQQGLAKQLVIRGAPDDRRDALPAEGRRGAEPPLPHDEFVLGAVVGAAHRLAALLADGDRLKHADLGERGLQLRQVLVIEDLPRLLRVGRDLVDPDQLETRAGNRDQVGIVRLDRRRFT